MRPAVVVADYQIKYPNLVHPLRLRALSTTCALLATVFEHRGAEHQTSALSAKLATRDPEFP